MKKVLTALNRMPHDDFIYHTVTHILTPSGEKTHIEKTIQGELGVTYCHYLKQKCLPGSSYLNVKIWVLF